MATVSLSDLLGSIVYDASGVASGRNQLNCDRRAPIFLGSRRLLSGATGGTKLDW